jgi:hypothetical protein
MWAEDPIVFKVRKLARDKNLSISKAMRRIVLLGLSQEDGALDQALDIESLQERHARDNRRLARRLSWLLIWLIFDVGQIKAHTTNMLGMQKGMTEDMFKDILKDADRKTRTRLSRKNPELTEFVDAIEQWLLEEEEESGGGTNPEFSRSNRDSLGANGHKRRGGSTR